MLVCMYRPGVSKGVRTDWEGGWEGEGGGGGRGSAPNPGHGKVHIHSYVCSSCLHEHEHVVSTLPCIVVHLKVSALPSIIIDRHMMYCNFDIFDNSTTCSELGECYLTQG